MKSKNIINVRNASIKEIKDIIKVVDLAYQDLGSYTEDMIRGQITNFSEGCFVVTQNDEIIAYSASLIISEKKALEKHTWNQITAG